MAVATQKSASSLMQKTMQRQQTVTRVKYKLNEKQVEKILLCYIKDGNTEPYKELLKVLQNCQLNDDNYRIVMEDSLSCVVLLGVEMNQYIDIICNINWANRNSEFVMLFSNFVINLVTAHTYHCPKVMTSLIKLFKDEPESWDDSPQEITLFKWSNIHKIIAQIIAMMPMCSDILMQTIIEHFPYYKTSAVITRAYIHNLIWMTKYIPLLQEQIITMIISRMVIMDVNIVDQTKKQKQIDISDGNIKEQDTVMESLDCCMLEILKWLEEEREPALNIMCNVFERVVLPTRAIRHVQFLLLYTISISQQCMDRILNNLWVVASGGHTLGPAALATRRTACSHLAGLLARCVRMPNSRLILYLKLMADWVHSYITATQEATTSLDNAKSHGSFHAICHAIFYLVAFKNHHLFMNKENLHFVESLNLRRLVNCALNPLRTCPPQVTHAFSSVTRSHQVVYCQAVIEKNNRHILQSSIAEQFDDWFPYDPYDLPRSGKVIWPLCIEYKDFLKESDSESQYTTMKRKLDDDDYLMLASPKKLRNTNDISPGFRTSETIIM
ncbi:hypothetical protein ACJJTC_008595 [Scirpophaga incertulas]